MKFIFSICAIIFLSSCNDVREIYTNHTELVTDAHAIVSCEKIEACQFKTNGGYTFNFTFNYNRYNELSRCALLKVGDEISLKQNSHEVYWDY